MEAWAHLEVLQTTQVLGRDWALNVQIRTAAFRKLSQPRLASIVTQWHLARSLEGQQAQRAGGQLSLQHRR